MSSYDDLAEELGRTIRLLRIDRDVERRDLAEQAGISYSYLSAIENGTKTPSARLLYSLAAALGVRDDELLAMARARADRPVAAAPQAAAAAAPSAPTPPAAPEPPARRRSVFRLMGAKPAPDDTAELATLLEQLEPDDAAAVLDLARRLAGKKPPAS